MSDLEKYSLKTLAARGLEEHVRITLIFSRIISFMLREFIILKNS